MPDAYHDQSHQHYCSIRTKDIQQNLRHRLSHTRADRACEVLDREKQRENERKKPNIEDMPIDMITPMGALQAALRVSSER